MISVTRKCITGGEKMIKKFVFWLYVIVGPAIVIFFTFTDNLVGWKLKILYTCMVFVPTITIPFALIVLIDNRLKILKSKLIKVLTPGIIYILGIACASFFIDFSNINIIMFPIPVLLFAIVITGITFLELYIYNKLVIGYKTSPQTDVENSSSESRKPFNLRSFAIKGFRILVTTLLILIIPFSWLANITVFNSEVKFKYDKYSYSQDPTSEHLASLASDLLYSNHFEDRLIYFDLVLKDPNALKIVYTKIESGTVELPALVYPSSETELYDLFLFQYLNTYLHQGNVSEYQKQFISKFNDLKSKTYMANYFSYTALIKGKSDKELPIIIDTMTNLYKTVQGSDKITVYKRVVILTVQEYCYMAMGNTEKQNEIDKQIKKLLDDFINSQKTSKLNRDFLLS
jgi:hypothetical protein